jgi:beta-mannanase
LASGKLAKTLRQFACQFWNVALQHNGSALLQFIDDGRQYDWMVVANIVNAVTGKKIDNASAVLCE